MKNQQRNQKQSKISSIEQQRDEQLIQNQNQFEDKPQTNHYSNSYSPIQPTSNLSNEYGNFYQGDNAFAKPTKIPEILYNNEGKPVSTIEYIKSQKDIEHLDFINTLLRLKGGTGYGETTASNYNNTNSKYTNNPYNIGQSFPKETSTIVISNDDSKSYIKEILDIYGECTSEQSPKKQNEVHGLKRNDLIEITNRRKKMAERPSNEVMQYKQALTPIETDNSIQMIQGQHKEITDGNNRNNNEKEYSDANSGHNNERLQSINSKTSIAKKPISNKSTQINNDNKDKSKSFNNIKNIRQIEDMVRETKKIESAMINSKQNKQTIANTNITTRQMKANYDDDNQSNQNPFVPKEVINDNKKQHSVGKQLKQTAFDRDKQSHMLKDTKVDENKNETSKSQKTLKPKINHKVSLSLNSKVTSSTNNAKSDHIEIETADIKIKNDIDNKEKENKSNILLQNQLGEIFSPNHNYYSNLLSLPQPQIDKAKEKDNKDFVQVKTVNTNLVPQLKPQQSNENKDQNPEVPIEKAEINLFDEDTNEEAISQNNPNQLSSKCNNNTNPSIKKIAQSMQAIEENQIEFDIDELLHPKYLFKNATNNNGLNPMNSMKRNNKTEKKIQQRNSQSISSIEPPLSEKGGSKDIHNFKQPHLPKINTTKVLPSYNKQKQKSNVDQMVLTTSPSKPLQNISQTPTSKQAFNVNKKKFAFEPRKSKESLQGSSVENGVMSFSQRKPNVNVNSDNTEGVSK